MPRNSRSEAAPLGPTQEVPCPLADRLHAAEVSKAALRASAVHFVKPAARDSGAPRAQGVERPALRPAAAGSDQSLEAQGVLAYAVSWLGCMNAPAALSVERLAKSLPFSPSQIFGELLEEKQAVIQALAQRDPEARECRPPHVDYMCSTSLLFCMLTAFCASRHQLAKQVEKADNIPGTAPWVLRTMYKCALPPCVTRLQRGTRNEKERSPRRTPRLLHLSLSAETCSRASSGGPRPCATS